MYSITSASQEGDVVSSLPLLSLLLRRMPADPQGGPQGENSPAGGQRVEIELPQSGTVYPCKPSEVGSLVLLRQLEPALPCKNASRPQCHKVVLIALSC